MIKFNFNPINDVLVGMMPYVSDFQILQRENWYRVRISKQTPHNLRKGEACWLGIYFPAIFKGRKNQIQFFAEITDIEECGFFDLFPNEIRNHPKADRRYYKVSVKNLRELDTPIVSKRGRRHPFISTTLAKFEAATEINDLYNESPLEDILWAEFKKLGIDAERQYLLETKNHSNYLLDFAVFCANDNMLDVECDGLSFHSNPARQEYDRNRNNDVTLENWSILRYSTSKIEHELPRVMEEITQKINALGGLAPLSKAGAPRYVNNLKGGQMKLFDM